MMGSALPFEPNWVAPPGDTIKDLLAARELMIGDLSAQIDLSFDEVEQLIEGQLPIDDSLAGRLASALGTSKPFWLRRESAYRSASTDERAASLEMAWQSFLAALPLRDMKAFGWFSDIDEGTASTAVEKFFEDDWGDWRRNGRDLLNAVAFRTSTAHASSSASVAAWLRQGVRQAESIECKDWNPTLLMESIPRLRHLSRAKRPADFFPQLVEICRQAGVAVVFVRTPAGCRASGATHFTPSGTPILQLSFRYRSDDHLWFTIFHEIGHLLLHRDSPIFVEGQDYVSGEEEAEANQFSAETLIPTTHRDELNSMGRDFRKIMRFAKKLDVSPGVIVGQMQKKALIRHDQMNFLKTRYDWTEIKDISL